MKKLLSVYYELHLLKNLVRDEVIYKGHALKVFTE